jgi:dihydroflavonol-4-reductase
VARAVHTSSATVLTGRHGQWPEAGVAVVDETCRTRESHLFGHYARSKWRAEALALSYADRLAVVVVLPTLPLGPGDRHLTPPTRMLLDFMAGKAPAYIDCLLNIVDVRDVAAGHVLACARGRSGRRYILNQHAVDMPTFLAHLEQLTGLAMPRWRIPRAVALLASAVDEAWSTLVSGQAPRAPLAGTRMGIQRLRFDHARARTELALPATPLLQTLMDACTWLSERGQITIPDPKPALAFGR